MGWLGLGSEPHVVGQLESEPRVGAGGYLRGEGYFARGLSPGSCLHGVISQNLERDILQMFTNRKRP